MCEYCGCQEVTAIGELTREHDEVVGLMAHVRSAHAVLGAAATTTPADPSWPAAS